MIQNYDFYEYLQKSDAYCKRRRNSKNKTKWPYSLLYVQKKGHFDLDDKFINLFYFMF